MSSLIRATNVAGFAELVTELGGEPQEFLDWFGIPPGVEHVEDAFISYSALARMLDAAARRLRCPDFGLRLAAWQGLHILGPVAVIARNSETVLDAFLGVGRYLHIHSPALHMSVARPGDPGFADGATTLHFSIDEQALPYLPQSYELSLANGMRIARLLAGESLRPRLVAFRHSRLGDTASYRDAFGSTIAFDAQWCGISLPDPVARRPIDNADPVTYRIVARYLDAAHPADEDVAPRVAALIRRLLPTGTCSAPDVSRHLGLHPRTLQRHLAREGTTFGDLLDRERADQAARLLAKPGLQMRQIAGLLGYTEQSSFIRSFRRWYGTTPGEYRRLDR